MAIDYRQFGPNGPPKDAFPSGISRQWWKLEGEEAAKSVTNTLKLLHDHDAQRLTQQMISARLYGNLPLLGLLGLSVTKLASNQPSMKDRVSYNIVQSVIDTVTSKIAKNKPKPLFLTSGGDYKLQRKAKKLNKFVDGVFYENQAHRLGVQCFRDACVFGDGVVHVFPWNGRVRYERVLPAEIKVDEIEGFYGEPRQMHRVKNVDRAVLAEHFPDAQGLIEQANAARPDEGGEPQRVSDLVTVRESWHLPSGEEAKDGRHLLSLDGGVLLEEEYAKDFFPFAVLPWSKRLFGFWGQGCAERLQNIQLEINKLLWVIQRSMHLAGSFKVFIENTSKIVTEHVNNDIGAMIRYTGNPPQYVTPPMVQPEVYQHLATLIQRAFEQEGVSMLSAAAKKPEGLDSGKALREFNDIESDRFMTVGHAYENFYLDLAKLSIAAVKDITSGGKKSYRVKVPGRRFIETIDWKEVNLDEDQYVMQCFPVSSLPSEPAGRMQTVEEMVQGGWISPRTGRRLMDFPDLDQVEDLANAEEEYLTQTIEKIVDEGEYTPPEPFDDLSLARELALQFYAQGKIQGLDNERMEMLRRFMAQLDAIEQAAAPPMPAPGMPGTTPQAVPAPPPQSDLIPNAPGIPGLQ